MRNNVSSSDQANSAPSIYKGWILRGIKRIKRQLEQRRAHKNSDKPEERAARSTATATWALVFFTVILGGVGYLQYTVIRDQLAEMRSGSEDTRKAANAAVDQAKAALQSANTSQQALIVSQEAFIVFSHFQTTPVIIGGELKGIRFALAWKNSGPTRATNFENYMNWKITSAEVADIKLLREIPSGIPAPFSFPGHHETQGAHIFIDIEAINEIAAKRKFLYIWCGSKYRTIFDQQAEKTNFNLVRVKVVRPISGSENPFEYEGLAGESD